MQWKLFVILYGDGYFNGDVSNNMLNGGFKQGSRSGPKWSPALGQRFYFGIFRRNNANYVY